MRSSLSEQNKHLPKGGGEMGELTRSKDWSKTSLGSPASWPQSLLTTLGIVIHSKFPMFIFWGPEQICFYNDAYRPSLGNEGKHPFILGTAGIEAWPETWAVIKPLIDQVLAGGEATWSEDQLIPIYRNGKLEDVYWTFSYSPINDESGNPAGVLVACGETTEKVRILKEVKEREDQLNFTLDAAGLATWDLDPITNKFTGNAWIKEWFGLSPENEIELPLALNNIVEQDRQKVIDAIQAALSPGSTGKYEIAYTIVNPKTGQERRVLAKGKALFENEKAYRFSGILEDVTIQSEARQKVEESEERLNIVIKASDLATWELNVKTSKVSYSQRYLEIFGYTKDTVLTHQQILKHLHPDDLHVRNKAFLEAYRTGVLNYVSRLIWNDNTIHWIEGRGKVFYDEENKPFNLIGTIRDITEEKNYQQQLEEREHKFRLLADSMPQHIWTADPEGNLNYFNQSVYDYSGLSPEQIATEGWLQIVHPDDRERNINEWTEAVETGSDFLIEHRFRRYDGEYHWQLSRAIPQKDADGKIQMWVGTSTNIQSQKDFAGELEKQIQQRTSELEQKNNDLEKMNSELQSFAYVSSHDLQEPLRKIQTFSSRILEKEYEHLTENGKDYFKRMQEAAKRMQTLIEDLLAYSRTNTTERIFKTIPLKEIVDDVKQELKELISENNTVIEIGKMVEATVIPFQFRQLLHNLIGNSIKFAKQEIAGHIKIESKIIAGIKLNIPGLSTLLNYCQLTVSDNGIGFDSQYKERIFEVFQRLHAKSEYKGTGIGLAIVKKIVENHNGAIVASGELNKGARFDIYIPCN